MLVLCVVCGVVRLVPPPPPPAAPPPPQSLAQPSSQTQLSVPKTRPPWGIKVYVVLQTTNIRNVDAASSSFYYDGVLLVSWRDDSLCYGPFPPGYLDGTFGFGLRRAYKHGDTYNYETDGRVSNYSWPYDTNGPVVTLYAYEQLQATSPTTFSYFVFGGTPQFILNDATTTDGTGTEDAASSSACYVVGSATPSGTFAAVQDLTEFPTDKQTLSMSYFNLAYLWSDMQFVSLPGSDAIVPSTPLPGFTFVSTSAEATPHVLAGVGAFAEVKYSIVIARKPDFYIQRFVVPLTLLQLMMIVSHITPSPRATRKVSSPLTAMMITTTFLFVYGQMVPALPYSTRLDWFFILCFVNCFVVHMVHVVSSVNWRRYASARRRRAVPLAQRRGRVKHDDGLVSLTTTTPPPAAAGGGRRMSGAHVARLVEDALNERTAAAFDVADQAISSSVDDIVLGQRLRVAVEHAAKARTAAHDRMQRTRRQPMSSRYTLGVAQSAMADANAASRRCIEMVECAVVEGRSAARALPPPPPPPDHHHVGGGVRRSLPDATTQSEPPTRKIQLVLPNERGTSLDPPMFFASFYGVVFVVSMSVVFGISTTVIFNV